MDQGRDAATAAAGDGGIEELLPDFDFFDPSHTPRADDVLRYAPETCPVPHTTATGGYYVATSYDAATRVLGDRRPLTGDEKVGMSGRTR